MNMTRKVFTTSAILVLMLALIFGAVGAQGETGTGDTPITETETTATKAYTHPVVQIMSAYFARKAAPKTPVVIDEPVEGEGDPVDEPEVEEPEVIGVTPEELAEEIARYHEEGMGFGVLVKLYAMAEASLEKCADTVEGDTVVAASEEGEMVEGEPAPGACTAVTVEELVAQFQSGTGMGQLFKEYGKPAVLGVGHVRKAQKNSGGDEVETPDTDETEIGEDGETLLSTQGAKPEKGKPAKDKQPKNKAPKSNGRGPNN
jgi:hypothetical protein